MTELQASLQAHAHHVLALEQEVQRLQFELRAAHTFASTALNAEHAELSRTSSELGQVSFLKHNMRIHSVTQSKSLANCPSEEVDQQCRLCTRLRV